MPRPILTPANTEPDKILLRRRDCIRWLGVTARDFDSCVMAGLIKWVQPKKTGRRYFHKDEIKRVFFNSTRVSR